VNVDQAMSRWRVGHHAFFVLLQGIILTHRRLEAALIEGDMHSAKRTLAQAARMLEGSAAAMRFAGDMPVERYQAVRESMTPPNVPYKFSGLWSIDHGAMIDGMKSLRERLTNNWGELETELQTWHEAIDRVYTAHACVCEYFVGNGPSLAMRSETSECARSALENIEVFRKRTLALVTPGETDVEEAADVENP
jgi:hypothetical protein